MTAEDGETPFINPVVGRPRRATRRRLNIPLLAGFGVAFLIVPIAYFVLSAPKLGAPNLEAANACLQNGDYACAEADYRAYLLLYPNDKHANAAFAEALTRLGKHKDALAYYAKALALGAPSYRLYALYAQSLDATGQLDQAIKMNYAALQIAPDLVDVRGDLADQLVRRGRTPEALSLLQSYDQSLVEAGQPPYFPAQIQRLRTGRAEPQIAAATEDELATGIDASKGATGRTEIPLESDHGVLLAPAMVDGALTFRFAVDSGSGDVVIPDSVVRQLTKSGQITDNDYVGTGLFGLADGTVVPSRIVRLHSIRVGDREVKDVTASIANDQAIPLLGQSFLRHFKSWSIDNKRRVLMLDN
jgi:predicted aspartyl protease